MRELLGNAYSFPTIFKSVLSSTCVSLWLLILFFCLLKNVTRPCLTFWHLVRLKVLQVVTVGAHNRYTYIFFFSLAQARNKMTEGMHGHAMIQRTNSFWNHQHTCNERKLGKAIAHFIVHNLFFSQVHSEIFRVFPSIASIQSCSRSTQLITGCYLNFIVSKFQSANAFTIETSNEHIKQNIYGRIFSRAFLHAKRHSNMRQKAKNGVNILFKNLLSSLETIQ